MVKTVTELKSRAGGATVIFGSGGLVSAPAPRGLIDEYRMIEPLDNRAGHTHVPRFNQRIPLKLAGSRTFDSNVVMLTYRPEKSLSEHHEALQQLLAGHGHPLHGALMIVLDVTIVNVALPSIRRPQVQRRHLAWANAYMLIFGGIPAPGRASRRLLRPPARVPHGSLVVHPGIPACGTAHSQEFLIVARGVAWAAAVDAVSLSIIINLFTETADRTKAMAVYGFVCSGGGCTAPSWRRAHRRLQLALDLPGERASGRGGVLPVLDLLPAKAGEATGPRHLDVGGAITVTVALLLAVRHHRWQPGGLGFVSRP